MYITWNRVAAKYGETVAKIDASAANSYWIPAAESEVNARLAPKYAVPMSPCPEMIADLVVDLVYYKLTYRNENQDKLKKYIDERFEGLLDGSVVLVDSGGTALATFSGEAWCSNSYRSSFGPDCAENWSVDQSAIDDAQDARL